MKNDYQHYAIGFPDSIAAMVDEIEEVMRK